MVVSSTRTTRLTGRVTQPSRFVGRSSWGAERRLVVVVEHDKATAQLTTLSDIASERTSERTPETIERVLEAAREELGMDVAFVSEFVRRRMVFRKLVGEASLSAGKRARAYRWMTPSVSCSWRGAFRT